MFDGNKTSKTSSLNLPHTLRILLKVIAQEPVRYKIKDYPEVDLFGMDKPVTAPPISTAGSCHLTYCRCISVSLLSFTVWVDLSLTL